MKKIFLIKPILLVFCLLAIHFEAVAQGWQESFAVSSGGVFSANGNSVTGLALMPNDSFVFSVNYPAGIANYYFGKGTNKGTDGFMTNSTFSAENGAFHHFSACLVGFGSNGLAVLEQKMPIANTNDVSLYLSKYDYIFNPATNFDPQYTLQWHKQVYDEAIGSGNANKVIKTQDGGFAVAGTRRAGPSDPFFPMLIRTDPDGEVLWTKYLQLPITTNVIDVLEAADGSFYLLGWRQVGSTAPQSALIKTDSNGNFLWIKELTPANEGELPSILHQTLDGNLAIASQASGLARLVKTDLQGEVLSRKDFAPCDDFVQLLEHPNGDLVFVCNVGNGIMIQKVSANGDPIWERKYAKTGYSKVALCASFAPDGGYLVGGRYYEPNISESYGYIFKTDLNGIIKPGLISGNVFNDLDLDCAQTAGDSLLKNLVVTAYQDSAHIFYGTTDAFGNYRMETDTGDYVVHLSLPSPLWGACGNDIPVHVGYLDTVQVDFGINPAIDCPFMTVDVASGPLRPCLTTRFYVKYANQGTIAAQNASIEVSLDPLLTILAAQIPPASVAGNVLNFDLGTVPALGTGGFWLDAIVACDSTIGRTLCVDAHIFPDSSCVPANALWSGALIELTGHCEGDSLHFSLKNVGSANSSPLDYIVIEDAVLLRTGSFQLDKNEEMSFAEAATGGTFHVMAQQEPNAPYPQLQIFGIENCTDGQPVSLGFLNQFSESDDEPYRSNWCQIVVSSFDPNDKQAFPTGFGSEHNIFAETELEYQLRFQNTGTDTAFRVILRDTLTKFLDPASIRLGASSHPCKLELDGNGVASFTFSGIHLPPAATNEAGSNGFVNFLIDQKPGNKPGTKIQNRAAIYFDYNAPVITNLVERTVHEPLIAITNFTQAPDAPQVRFSAFPNPFSDQIWFELGQKTTIDAQLELFSTNGQRLKTVMFAENSAILTRNSLPEGAYFFTIKKSDGGILGSGTVIVQ